MRVVLRQDRLNRLADSRLRVVRDRDDGDARQRRGVARDVVLAPDDQLNQDLLERAAYARLERVQAVFEALDLVAELRDLAVERGMGRVGGRRRPGRLRMRRASSGKAGG